MFFNIQNYQFSIGKHHNKDVIFVHFSYSLQLKNELKEKFSSAKWSVSLKCWYLPDINSIRKEIGFSQKTEMGKGVISQIHSVNLAALKQMHETLLLKAYSPNTIRTYCVEFSQLLYLLKDISVETLTADRLRYSTVVRTRRLAKLLSNL